MYSKAWWNLYNTDYRLISWLFLRGLGIIYFSAFASMAVQIQEGLVGANGILPISEKMALIEQYYPQQLFWHMPTVFWFNASDLMLSWTCYLGMAAAFLLLISVFTRIALIVCYILYLSVVEAGQDFTHFQWDVFLLETGFLAIFLSWGSGIIILLYKWLLARFMFMGGVVKIASGDPTWANFSALNFHYETQPLPTPVAYYVSQLSSGFHKVCVGGVFFIELVVPFFVFFPKKYRVFACYSFVFLQSAIILTGNYTFFNLLTILLCLFLLEDKDIAKILPQQLISKISQKKLVPGFTANLCAGIWATLVLLICALQIGLYQAQQSLNSPLAIVLSQP